MGIMDLVRTKMNQRRYEKDNAGLIAQERLKKLKEQRAVYQAKEDIRQEKVAIRKLKYKPLTDAAARVSSGLKKMKAERLTREKQAKKGKIVSSAVGSTSKDHLSIGRNVYQETDINEPEWLRGK